MDLLRWLRARRYDLIKLVISDAHSGLKATISRVFKMTWHRCLVHCICNAIEHVQKGHHTFVTSANRRAYYQPNPANLAFAGHGSPNVRTKAKLMCKPYGIKTSASYDVELDEPNRIS